MDVEIVFEICDKLRYVKTYVRFRNWNYIFLLLLRQATLSTLEFNGYIYSYIASKIVSKLVSGNLIAIPWCQKLHLHLSEGLLMVVSKRWFEFGPASKFLHPVLTSIKPQFFLNFTSFSLISTPAIPRSASNLERRVGSHGLQTLGQFPNIYFCGRKSTGENPPKIKEFIWTMWQIGVLTGKPCTFLVQNGSFSVFWHYKNKERLLRFG